MGEPSMPLKKMTTIVTPILAIPFVSPGFLLAGAALVALPILIHILNRRRYKVVHWAAMEYLLAAMKKNRKRLKFEQWLLLATRCAVLLFLGLALARPLGCGGSTIAALAAERTGLHVFIIDNSYSMAYDAGRPDAKTHLDQAKRIAKTILSRLSRGGESVAIVTAGAPATSVIAHPTYDVDAAISAMDRIEQGYSGTDLVGAMQKALELAKDEARQPIKKLYILSDSTRSALDAPQAVAALKQLGPEVAGQFSVTYFNLGRRDQWNQAALEVRPINHLVTSKFNNDFEAIVKGFGPGPQAMLQWKLDNQILPGGGTVKLDLDTPPQLQSNAQLKTGGPRVLTANLVGEDRLRIDDTRSRVVDVASELKVLIVEGDRGVGLLSGSAAFLDLALAPPKEAGGQGKSDSYVAPEVISDLELGNKVLGDYRAVILTNVGQVQPQQAESLEKFVRAGGTLMIYMGELVNADNYNKVLLPHGLIPGALTRRMSVGSDQKGFLFDFKPEGDLHPLLQIFRHEDKSGLDTAQVFTYWQVDLPQDAKVEHVLDYFPAAGQHKDPAITAHSLGSGRVVYVSTSAGDWTSLPAKPVYVTLVHELLSGSVTPDDAWMNRLVGQSVELPATVKLTSTPRLTDAAKKEIPLEQITGKDGQSVYRTRPMTHPGVYTLETGERTYPIAVNVPADEADVRTIDPAAVKSALGDINITIEGDQPPVEMSKNDPGKDFGWSFMLIVLGLVAMECFMAMEFGHYKRK
jgi:hypothetical protein